jgi:HD-GYP domain-containing protein (c-di-GMP phosphodiesterase class II)
MIKKITIGQLRIGMYVQDFNCGWLDHPFARNQMMVSSIEQLQKIRETGIKTLFIDTDKGSDVQEAPSRDEADVSLEKEIVDLAKRVSVTPAYAPMADEIKRASKIKLDAQNVVREVMQDARLGRAIKMDQVETVVQDITESILRNPGALIGLLKIKTKDDYTFFHSVGVCTLLVAFCRSMGIDEETTRQAGLGGLLHDVGKALVPDDILNKPGKLTDEEFHIIRQHPQNGYDILLKEPTVGPIPLDITLRHHERVDGSGYPGKLAGDDISQLAKMAAIVDVYDAITADRCYHKGMSAAEALRKIYEWSKFHFDPALVQSFMRCVGIYPVGTLVKLESGRLGVVTRAHETNLLAPMVNVFFSIKSNTYIRPQEIDLAKPFGAGGGDKIVSHENPEKWRVDPMKFFSMV